MKKLFILIIVTFSMAAMASESLKPENCAATQSSQKREMGKKIAQSSAPIAVPEKQVQVNRE